MTLEAKQSREYLTMWESRLCWKYLKSSRMFLLFFVLMLPLSEPIKKLHLGKQTNAAIMNLQAME